MEMAWDLSKQFSILSFFWWIGFDFIDFVIPQFNRRIQKQQHGSRDQVTG
jgi:hypothetical protein